MKKTAAEFQQYSKSALRRTEGGWNGDYLTDAVDCAPSWHVWLHLIMLMLCRAFADNH